MIEIQDIFIDFGMEFQKEHKLSPQQQKALRDIGNCRSAALGGHVDQCDTCGHIEISYNSCRNRHCPKCQNLNRERWLIDREQELLDVGYFHIVFTIPATLNPLALRNQKTIYNILFRAASESLRELAADPKYLGAEIGILAVLHTWGQNLMEHPHIHCLVPGGGLSPDGLRWINSSKKFFIPVKVLSRKFRGKFLAFLKEAMKDGVLEFIGQITYLNDPSDFRALIDGLYQADWVVYSKKPFAGAAHVLRYLGRYTHRVAISNHRIVSCKNAADGPPSEVTFKYRDYRDNKQKLMTITAQEFIRRFLLHILPSRFTKVRYYGIFGNRVRKTKIQVCQKLLNMKLKPNLKLTTRELIIRLTGKDPGLCPACQTGRLYRSLSFPGNSPPGI
jgi:hypothetical protein